MKLSASFLWFWGSCAIAQLAVLPPSEPTLVAPRPSAPPGTPKPVLSTPAPAPLPMASPLPVATPRPGPVRFVRPPTPGQLLTAMSKRRTALSKDLAKATAAKKRPNTGTTAVEELTRLEVHSFYLRHREHVLLQRGFKGEPLGETPILFDAFGLPYWIDGYGAWRYDF